MNLDLTSYVRNLCADGSARRIRTGARVSLAELAGEIGTTKGAVSLYERSLRVPSAAVCVRYAPVLQRLSGIAEEFR